MGDQAADTVLTLANELEAPQSVHLEAAKWLRWQHEAIRGLRTRLVDATDALTLIAQALGLDENTAKEMAERPGQLIQLAREVRERWRSTS